MKKILSLIALSTLFVLSVIALAACQPKDTVPALDTEQQETVPTYTVKVESDSMRFLTFSGGDSTQTVKRGESINPITVSAELGYKVLSYTVNGQSFNDSTITLDNVVQDTTINVVCGYATDELPIVNINTDGAEINDKEKYVDMTFSIENCDDELTDIGGGIRLRGNTTSTYDKKPYRIKFAENQSLFGLTAAKSWVLLADYLDPSCMHNYTALTLGNNLDGLEFTPTPHHVNVYLNGSYIGLYVLCEQVQENEGRMNIKKKIKDNFSNLTDYNFFISMDYSSIGDSGAVLDETCFYLEDYNKYIELKYPEKSDFKSEEQFSAFFGDLKEYVKTVFDAFANVDTGFINEYIDVDSLIDYLVVDEIMLETDHSYKSFNMYYKGGENKLYFGPIWDYDWCLFTPWTSRPNVHYDVAEILNYSNVFFRCVSESEELLTKLKTRYFEIADLFDEVIFETATHAFSMKESLKMNSIRWYGGTEIMYDNVEFLNRFLICRRRYLNTVWGEQA